FETSSATCSGCNTSPYTTTRLNPLNVREYDWANGAAGPLVRTTSYAYLHAANTNYLNANIADRPTSMTIYDGNGNQVAQTTTAIRRHNPQRDTTKPRSPPHPAPPITITRISALEICSAATPPLFLTGAIPITPF